MAIAAGISIDAAVAYGLIGLTRRPRDAVRIAFAAQAIAVAVGALAIIAMYAADTPREHAIVMKWAFFPAGATWVVATVWMVAFYTRTKPTRWLLALTAAYGAVVVLDLALPYGLLQEELGTLTLTRMAGTDISMSAAPMPHPLNVVADALLFVAFAFMFYAVWRSRHRGRPRRTLIAAAVVLLFLVASVADLLQHYGVIAGLYYTQFSFVVLVIGVSIGLGRESLRVEANLRSYRAKLEAEVDERLQQLDEANAKLALEVQERLATEESLRLRVAELNALQRVSRTLADRHDLKAALDQTTPEIAALFSARYAHIDLAAEGEASCASPDGQGCWPSAPERMDELLVVPLVIRGTTLGTVSIGRRRGEPFTDQEHRLAQTVADDIAAAVENERLHAQQAKQAAEDERQRLARDLHDAVTQTIYSATLIAEALPAAWERDPGDALHNLTRLRRLVRGALAEMRTLLFELRPAALEAASLDDLLARLGDALAGQIQVPIEVRVDEGLALPSDVKVALYRIAQEALNNIAKHARATNVAVHFHAQGAGGARLIVADDGNGFELGAVAHDKMGLRIMRERADRVGASLVIDTEPDGGTTISAGWLPEGSEREAEAGEHERVGTH
jgi:signal transduction histidine kinase